ncbi:hypothetical protein AK812_SmicGene15281 [Symbiodinium microadriaticum]|uniref:Uncharacterized protein n=1 Tax=Symbiodinium microadriaticum TaxID=2951 RepID=A0A1Q9E3D4_SYMMI|nr:hypothetical protein AK812_SmicGene15281 [Symbiodinium microadriaticum]
MKTLFGAESFLSYFKRKGDRGNDLGKVTDQIQASIQEVEKAEHEAKSALASSTSVLESSPSAASLQDLVQVLETEKASTQELLQKVSMQTSQARKGGVSSKPVLNSLLPLLPRLRSVQASLSTELQKVRVAMSKSPVATKPSKPKRRFALGA